MLWMKFEVWKYATRCQDWKCWINHDSYRYKTPARNQVSETDSEMSFDFHANQYSEMQTCLSIPEVVVRASSPPAPARFFGFAVFFNGKSETEHLQRMDLRLEGDMPCRRFLPNLRLVWRKSTTNQTEVISAVVICIWIRESLWNKWM